MAFDNESIRFGSTTSMRRVFYLTCALIAYGSLYPFHIVVRNSPLGVLSVFAASLHVHLDRGELHDLIVNLLIYIPVGFFFVLDERDHHPAWRRCLNATLAGAALSLCMETAQYWVEPRSPSLIDLLTNTISAAAGAILGVAFAHRARHAFDSLSETVLGHPSSALFLGILWCAALFTPGDWGRSGAVHQIRAMLAAPHFAPGHVLVSFSQWLGMGALAAAVIGRNRAPFLLLLAGLATPLRFFVPGQRPELHDFLGAAAAICVWYTPAFRRRLSTGAIAFMLAGGLLVEGLRPWHFSSRAAGFQWIPFLSMLDSPDWAPTLLVLFRKAAFYGTAVWSVARAGLGVRAATVIIGVQLGLLEVAQMFLPGRTAETTDPLLALMLGMILLHFDHKFGADPGVGTVLLEADERTSPGTAAGEYAPSALSTATKVVPPAGALPTADGIWTGGRRRGL
jgi:VanZ family protein